MPHYVAHRLKPAIAVRSDAGCQNLVTVLSKSVVPSASFPIRVFDEFAKAQTSKHSSPPYTKTVSIAVGEHSPHAKQTVLAANDPSNSEEPQAA